jgi:hypothetical protein
MMTHADVTALTLFQAVMAVPGGVVPNDPDIERATVNGERVLAQSAVRAAGFSR